MFSSVLLAIGVLTFCLDVTSSASISTSLSNGVCLCTNEQNVAALRDRMLVKLYLVSLCLTDIYNGKEHLQK